MGLNYEHWGLNSEKVEVSLWDFNIFQHGEFRGFFSNEEW
jgi:hypothetical protein